MKERVVIEDKEVREICDDCIMSENCKKKNTYEQARCCFNFRFIPANIETEQVPETWEELKELCKELKGLCKNYNIEVFDDAIFVLDNKVVLLKVYDDGEIKDSGSEVIAENRTPERMWQIIKSITE